jgi:sterol desaturase/sphingolipid hydroxylase (fatty acid hydroxylase superfamily)
MEAYGHILLFAMPAFLLLVLFEKWYGWRKDKDTVRNMDMISSLSSGVTNVTKEVLGLTFVILGYSWLVQHIALMHIGTSVLTYIIAFFVIDFAGYWGHRWNHRVNFFWNYHIIHHSSEDFNLACALRQSVSMFINPFHFLLIPAALLGVPAVVIATVAPLQLFAQFWYHTQHINKMGLFEKILVTPSHHRVHHAVNKEYIDKNLSQIFIFWDKIFGTFQEELTEAPPVYGITRPVKTWNPIRINFQHWWLLLQDAWRTKSIKDKFLIWVKPTGWRPEDVIEKHPVYKMGNLYTYEKYAPKTSRLLHVWSWIQLVTVLLFISYLFGFIARIGAPAIYYYGGFIFLFVYAFTELMDRNPFAIFWEIIKNVYGIAIIYRTGDWFHANDFIPGIRYVLIGYFLLSTVIVMLLVIKHKREDAKDTVAFLPAQTAA